MIFKLIPTCNYVYAREGLDFNTTRTMMFGFHNDPSDLSWGKLVSFYFFEDAKSQILFLMVWRSHSCAHSVLENKEKFLIKKFQLFISFLLAEHFRSGLTIFFPTGRLLFFTVNVNSSISFLPPSLPPSQSSCLCTCCMVSSTVTDKWL